MNEHTDYKFVCWRYSDSNAAIQILPKSEKDIRA